MSGYVAAVWGWDEAFQRAYHDRVFNPGRWQIITADGADVGMLDVERRQDAIYLARIELLPGFQGRGIGTYIVGGLLDEAAENGKDLLLDVLAVNARAVAFYQRLGISEIAGCDVGEVKMSMRWRSPRP